MKKGTWLSVGVIIATVSLPVMFGYQARESQKAVGVLSSIKVYAQVITPTPTLVTEENHTPEQEQIISYIKEVFGKDQDKAFKLLSCENKSLNPKAVNDNTTWGGVGRDWGIFQINDTWQAVQPKFLKNWKINIQIAKQLFDENGKKFNLWTCGRNFGI